MSANNPHPPELQTFLLIFGVLLTIAVMSGIGTILGLWLRGG